MQIAVIKLGTGTVTQPGSAHLDEEQVAAISAGVARAHQQGFRCVLVSSGAVGAGLAAFDLAERPKETVMLQACAAVGQTRLMHSYESSFRPFGLHVAQLLVTDADFRTEARRENFRRTLEQLLSFPDVIPIINENDSVATEELTFGDNDALSAQVAQIAGAGQLVLLTAVDGLCDAEGGLVESVGSVDEALALVRPETGQFSVGGMATKLEAVRHALGAGIQTVVANGRNPGQLLDLLQGSGKGTRFEPAGSTTPHPDPVR